MCVCVCVWVGGRVCVCVCVFVCLFVVVFWFFWFCFFLTISSLRREASPTRTLKWPGRNRVQITCSTSSAYHVQHVVLHATWYEGTAELLSLTVEIVFI